MKSDRGERIFQKKPEEVSREASPQTLIQVLVEILSEKSMTLSDFLNALNEQAEEDVLLPGLMPPRKYPKSYFRGSLPGVSMRIDEETYVLCKKILGKEAAERIKPFVQNSANTRAHPEKRTESEHSRVRPLRDVLKEKREGFGWDFEEFTRRIHAAYEELFPESRARMPSAIYMRSVEEGSQRHLDYLCAHAVAQVFKLSQGEKEQFLLNYMQEKGMRPKTKLGRWIKDRCLERGISYRDLARSIGVDSSTLHFAIRGEGFLDSEDGKRIRRLLAWYFGVEVDEIP